MGRKVLWEKLEGLVLSFGEEFCQKILQKLDIFVFGVNVMISKV